MTNPTILVTGGAGYVGSICTEKLLAQGYRVVVVDNLKTGHAQAVHPQAVFVHGSIGNRALLARIFEKHTIYAVVHFAGETLVTAASTDPERYFINNVVYGLNLLAVMRKYECRRIIFSSTAAVYGEPERFPIDEDHPTKPLNAYGESKLTLERILHYYHSAYDFRAVIFRYFNAAGASERFGELHQPETHLLPLVLQVPLAKRSRVDIYGDDYDTPDGTCIRDYVHVVDIAQAHLLSLEKIDQLGYGIYNLGNGTGFSVRDVIKVAETVSGTRIPTRTCERRPGDPARLVASHTRAQRELGWRPRYPALEEIIESAWRWRAAWPNGYE
ncbi:MAG: UDP-glucose 4-epimerase GalE [Anaerolineales bacterium]